MIRRWYHAHWQNLDEDRAHRVKGRGWRHGRAWLDVGPMNETKWPCRPWNFGISWVLAQLGHNWFGASVALGEGDSDAELQASVQVPGAALYLHADTPLTRKLTGLLCRKKTHGYRTAKELRLSIGRHPLTLRSKIWTDPWSEDDAPKWRDLYIELRPLIFGRAKYHREVIEEREVLIPMPERAYPATAVLTECTWTHQRFGWPRKRVVRVELEVPGGIPVPGKGENAWDCGDDATLGMTTPADSIPEGIAHLVQSLLTKRERYGGRHWAPPVTVG